MEFEDWRLSDDCDFSDKGVVNLEGIDIDHIIEFSNYRADIPFAHYWKYDGSYTTPSCAGKNILIS